MMAGMLNDLRQALRVLYIARGFSVVAIATLALGVGVSTAVFTVVNAVVLRPLPFPHPDRLVAISTARIETPDKGWTVSLNDLEDWQRASKTIETFGAWRDWSFRMRTPSGSESVYAVIATPGLFKAFPVTPIAGRMFRDDDDRPGSNQVVLISEAFWRSHFNADRNIVGRTLTLGRAPLGDRPFTIVGVLPATFEIPSFEDIAIWAPSSYDVDAGTGRKFRNRQVFARLREGASIEAARVELRTIAAGLARQYSETNAGWTTRVVPLIDREVGPIGSALMAFLGAVAFVMLIASVNIASLVIARTTGRRRELAIRQALGAGRFRVAWQVFAESIVIALVGGLAGLLVSVWLVDLLLALGPSIPRAGNVAVDLDVFAFALGLAVVSALLFGLAPALRETTRDLTAALKDERRSVSRPPLFRFRTLLVSCEVALTLVLLAVALLAARAFLDLIAIKPGLDTNNLLVLQVFPSIEKYPTQPRVAAVYDRIATELRAIPGVRAAAATSGGPLFGGPEPVEFELPGRPFPPDAPPSARYFNIGPGYFAALGVRFRAGRDFTDADRGGAPPVTIVNEALAARYFPDQNAVGQTLVVEGASVTIVGVVANMLSDFEREAAPRPQLYWPYHQRARWASYFVLRTNGETGSVLAAARARLAAIDSELKALNVSTMDAMLERTARSPRFLMLLLGFFAALAVLLSLIGVYGLVSYAVAQRTREIGVRISLGASRRDVLRSALGGGAIAVLAGTAGGILLALGAQHTLRALVPQLGPLDGGTLIAVAITLSVAGLLACYAPGRRALSIDPIRALREE